MGALLFLFGAALAAGLYFILADLLKIPGWPQNARSSLLDGGSEAWSSLWKH